MKKLELFLSCFTFLAAASGALAAKPSASPVSAKCNSWDCPNPDPSMGHACVGDFSCYCPNGLGTGGTFVPINNKPDCLQIGCVPGQASSVANACDIAENLAHFQSDLCTGEECPIETPEETIWGTCDFGAEAYDTLATPRCCNTAYHVYCHCYSEQGGMPNFLSPKKRENLKPRFSKKNLKIINGKLSN